MNYRLLAKLFNSSEIKKSVAGDLELFRRVATEFKELSSLTHVSDFYDEAYRLLLRHYRNEYVFKNEIANKILLGRHSLNTTAMMSELRTGNNIADCVVINGYSTCYEIKTEYDTLSRFREQLSSYLNAYDKTYVVTHESHLDNVLSIQKEIGGFGVIEFTKRRQLKTLVEAPISSTFDFAATFETLRKAEYLYIAKQVRGEIPDMPNTEVYDFCKNAYRSLSASVARELFKDSLKKYRGNDRTFVELLPKSLKNVGISYQLSRHEKNRLLCSVMHNASAGKGDEHVFPVFERQAP
ncbi:sce7726 family protein [Enterovibrio paralichthyis]|uniref:sce7726 family protein n=1 Tax=Enterovibrio paralichthyis TaxID=2853805 RepID=UPI001C46E1E1|nr:sce7726 family protein [Enterovibrio paralichthyis]MBV7300362.1 sce7726 family protein [Enterovibrio paralichthyis]